MKKTIRTLYYTLAVIALLAECMHEVFTNKRLEVDDFQISVDQNVYVVSCYLLEDTSIYVYQSFLDHMLTTFGRYDPHCNRQQKRIFLQRRPKKPE